MCPTAADIDSIISGSPKVLYLPHRYCRTACCSNTLHVLPPFCWTKTQSTAANKDTIVHVLHTYVIRRDC